MAGIERIRTMMLSAGFALGLAGACANDSGTDDCPAGQPYCPCAAGQCLPGLQCIGNYCVGIGTSETGDAGDGDPGDGDSGDGDPSGDGDGDCEPGMTFCGGKCVDTQANPLHCGGCDMACDTGEVCDGGGCLFIEDCTQQECPGFSYCDLETMLCVPGCTLDEQCAVGEVCDLGTHQCDCPPAVGSCTSDDECPNSYCYVIPFLGGMCGECSSDDHCTNGCTPPNYLGPEDLGPDCLPVSGAYCNDGSLGEGCETDAACVGGLTCELAMDLLGLIMINGCSDCASDADCGAQICTAIIEFGAFRGHKTCIPPGSLAQNEMCDLEGNGDEACASGICSTVDIMGLAQIGVCGECDYDGDCGFGGICDPGSFDINTGVALGSTCI
jgi:hypothetical protein